MNDQPADVTRDAHDPVKVSLIAAAPNLLPEEDLLGQPRTGHVILASATRVRRSSAYDIHGPTDEAPRLERLRAMFAEPAYDSAPVVAARLQDVRVDMDLCVCALADGRILDETAIVAEIIFKGLESSALLRPAAEPAEIMPAPILHLFHRSSAAYGHFILDGLVPLVRFLPAIQTGRLDVLVPHNLPDWALDIMAELGVPRGAFRKPPGAVIHCRDIILVSTMNTLTTYFPTPDLCTALAEALPALEQPARGRLIYLSRARQTSYSQRRLLNEDALVEILAARGFEILEPGNMPFPSQVRAFAEASVIIGAHGSAFGGLVFARPGTTVIDLMPADWVGFWDQKEAERWLLNLTTAMRLDYHVIMCRSRMVRRLPDEDQSGWQKFGMDSEPDLDLIRQVVDGLVLTSSPARRDTSLGVVPSSAQPPEDAIPDRGLQGLLSPSLDPLFRFPDCSDTESTWSAHAPFAFWLVGAVRPRTLLELGSLRGVSYLTFCQAVLAERLDTRCHAVGGWEGDALQDEFLSFNDTRYAGISTIHRSGFDNALSHFADGSVDILHLDGPHNYEAARQVFDAWLPKMSTRGVILLHHAHARQPDFGVWRLWDEVAASWPSFLLPQSQGIGMLCVGPEVTPELLELCRMSPAAAGRLFERLGLIGARWQGKAQAVAQAGRLESQRIEFLRLSDQQAGKLMEQDAALEAQARKLLEQGGALEAQARKLQEQGSALEAQARKLQEQAGTLQEQDVALEAQGASLRASELEIERLRDIERSFTWRATAPARQVMARFPGVSSLGRRVLRVIRRR